MIIGIGTDLCDTNRVLEAISRQGDRFLNRLFTKRERTEAEQLADRHDHYARRFAAKEACAKGLGTGITQRVRWHDIEVLSARGGCPELHLSGGAHRRLQRLTPKGSTPFLHLTITDEPPLAMAFVVIEARGVDL